LKGKVIAKYLKQKQKQKSMFKLIFNYIQTNLIASSVIAASVVGGMATTGVVINNRNEEAKNKTKIEQVQNKSRETKDITDIKNKNKPFNDSNYLQNSCNAFQVFTDGRCI
jgi:hypothetical protein